MFKKLIFYVVSVSLILVLTQGCASNPGEEGYKQGKSANCVKVWKEWFKAKHKEAQIELKSCLETATTQEEVNLCHQAYKISMQELRKTLREKIDECKKCIKEAKKQFKERLEAAKEILKSCLAAAETKEDRKACKNAFKKTVKELKKTLKQKIKECFKCE